MDAGSSKETSCRSSCREGNRPQPLEVAALLKLAATNVRVSMKLVSEGVEIRSRCGVWAERRAWGNNRAATVSERA
ncbi:MAG: hypothetical protein ACKO3T_15455 [Planctomycetaceae bacterium]